MSKLLLVDANALYWRAHHALSKHNLSFEGAPTWGIFGAFNSLASVVRQQDPTHVLAAFDGGASTYRKGLFPQYKESRHKEMSDEHVMAHQQLARTERLMALSGVFTHTEQGVEADDVIAACVHRFRNDVEQVTIVSGDKDFLQLVSPNVHLLRPSLSGKKDKPEEYFTEKEVWDRYGVAPHRLVDLWGLMGDPGDGVPGVPGVGPKTALALLQEHGTISNVLASGHKKVLGHEAEAALSYKLVELNGQVATIPFHLQDLLWNPVVPGERGRAFARELEDLGLQRLQVAFRDGTLWRGRMGSRFRPSSTK